MSLLENWRNHAYEVQMDEQTYQEFWATYFSQEKDFYESMLQEKEPVKGTVASLAEKYNVTVELMTGILDGINDSLKVPNPIETMEEDTEVSLDYDKEALYKNMVVAKADWLYNLPIWEELLTPEKRAELYKAGKLANTVVKGKKIGRNDPCPCGSGLKYKKCHGKNA